MNQLFQIIISLLIGIFYGFIFKYISKSMLITCIITFTVTIGYIYIIFLLNMGTINYILKLSIISGFILYTKVSNLIKKV